MEIFVKILASMISVGLIGAGTALAIAGPSKHSKLVELVQQGVYFLVNAAVLYFIWTW